MAARRSARAFARLLFSDGTRKPSFDAWRFPFVADRKNRRKVRLWARSPDAGVVRFQVRKRGRWRTIVKQRAGRGDVATRTVRLRGKRKLRAKIGSDRSRRWKVGKRG